MCGRAVLTSTSEAIREWFGVEEVPADMPPRFNIAPSQVVAVLRTRRRLELLRWGLLRPGRPPQINMRVESIARTADRQRRCLVVVDGFYEWRDGAKPPEPHLIREAEGRLFALGGVWQSATTEDGEVVESVAILTCPAGPPIAEFHDRMPLIVPPSAYDRWLRPGEKVSDLLVPTDTPLVSTRVGSYVNSPANDGPQCLEPAEPPPQASLF
jgi:putative SOS response-associated peptidase YedK